MTDKTQSKIIREIVKESSIEKTLNELHVSFKSLCDKKGLSCTSDALGQLGQEDLRNLTLSFLSSVQGHSVPGLLPSKKDRGCLRNDLLEFLSAASSSDFDFERVKPLLITALTRNLDNSVFWDQVYNAITESDSPRRPIASSHQQTPWLLSRSTSPDSAKHHQDVGNVLKRILGAICGGLRHFYDTFFEALATLAAASGGVFKERIAGSNLSQRSIRDRLLNLDLSPDDCYYRLRREDNNEKRVIYVHVADISILPEDSRTSNHELVRALSKLNGWYDKWDTLTVSRLGNEIHCLQDHFKPHTIPLEKMVGEYPFFDVLDLCVVSRKNQRVTYVDNGTELCYLKIARFDFEVGRISRELEAYDILTKRKSQLGPELLGYAFEGSQDRVVGFLLKAIHGRPACISDLEDCEKALRELHASGLLHGDLVKYNILITSEGPRFIDFENSSSRPPNDLERWNSMREQELCSLEAALLDSSGAGQPWDY